MASTAPTRSTVGLTVSGAFSSRTVSGAETTVVEGTASWSAFWRSSSLSSCARLTSIGFETVELEKAAFGRPFPAFWAPDFHLFFRCSSSGQPLARWIVDPHPTHVFAWPWYVTERVTPRTLTLEGTFCLPVSSIVKMVLPWQAYVPPALRVQLWSAGCRVGWWHVGAVSRGSVRA